MRRFSGLLLLVAVACGVEPGGADPASTASPPTTSPVTTSPVSTTPVTVLPATTEPVENADCPQVIRVVLEQTAPELFTVHTTVRSIDVADVSYADAWEVRGTNGEVLGERILTHPHANEQPFTRSLTGVPIPRDVAAIEVAARDSVRGFCGPSLTVEVAHS